MSETDIASEAEHLLRGLADELTRPRQRECLACFVARMLNEFGCDETLRFARRYRDQAAPRATALERRLGDRGGFCDCEIFLNAYSLDRRFWTPEREVESDDGYVEIIDAEPPGDGAALCRCPTRLRTPLHQLEVGQTARAAEGW